MKAIVMTLLVAVSLMVFSLPYEAVADCGVRTSLSAPDGAVVAASGVAYVGSLGDGAQQTFTVQVDAAVPDGTQLMVFANGEPAGMITVTGGTGTLDLSNVNGPLPAGVDPVCGIGPVWVTDAGQTTTLLHDPDFN